MDIPEFQNGQEEEAYYRQNGANDDQIDQWKSQKIAEFRKYGANDTQIADYFGLNHDNSAMKAYAKQNMQAAEGETKQDGPREAKTFGEQFEAAWENSVPGLFVRNKAPDLLPPEHANMAYRIMEQLSQTVLDAPIMALAAPVGAMFGAPAGGALGSVVPGVGTLGGIGLGAAAGGTGAAFAAPAAMRKLLMDEYEKGPIKDSGEFTSRLAAATWEAIKQGGVGAITGLAGAAVKPIAGAVPALAAELGTMTTAGAALEGRLPNAQDFADGAAILGIFHGVTGYVPQKLRNIYRNTGETPAQVVEEANNNPIVKQDILASNPKLPEQAAPPEPEAPKEKPVELLPAETMNADELRQAREKEVERISKLGEGGFPDQKFTAKNGEEYTISMEPSNYDNKEEWAPSETEGHKVPIRAFEITVKDKMGHKLGQTLVDNGKGWPDKFVVQSTGVNENLRRNGIMTAMYDYAEKQGLPLRPGRTFGEGINQFWAKRDVTPGLWAKSTDPDFKGRVTQYIKKGETGYGRGFNETDSGLDKQRLAGQLGGGKEPTAQEPNELDKALAGPKGEGEPPKHREPPDGGEPPHPDDLQKALDYMGTRIGKNPTPDVPSIFSREGFVGLMRKFYKNFVNERHFLSVFEDESGAEGLKDSEKPSVLAAKFNDWKGVFKHFISFGTLNADGSVRGESLESIVDGLNDKEKDELMKYAVSRRALEREDVAKETGIDQKQAQIIVDGFKDKYEDRFKRLVKWSDDLRQYATDKGLISKESNENISKGSEAYIPFFRVQDLDKWTNDVIKGLGGFLPEMEGSKRLLLNPYASLINNAARIIRGVHLNEIGQRVGDIVDHAPEGWTVGERIGEPTDAQKVAPNVISYIENGIRRWIAVKPETAEALKSVNFDPQMVSMFTKLAASPASWLRTGTVLNPDFIMRHGWRSFLASIVQSENMGAALLKMPFDMAMGLVDNVMGAKHIWTEDEVYQAAVRHGAVQNSTYGIQDYLGMNKLGLLGETNVFGLNDKTGNWIGRAWNSFLSPLQYMAHLSDNAARVAEFKRAGGLEGGEKAFSAGFAARNLTVDYQRAGALTRNVSSIIPFANIGIQGFDRMIRGWGKDPIGFTSRAVMALTVPSIAVWAHGRGDSRYDDAPDWEKNLYWIIPTNKWEKAQSLADASSRPEEMRRQAEDGSWEVNNGVTLRIPKPFELGMIFGTLPEQALNRFYDGNPRAGSQFLETLRGGIVSNVMPTALVPFAEQWANKNFFTGRPVVSSHAEGLLPEYQYNEYTSQTARILGKMLGYVGGDKIGPKDAKLSSPMVIDNWIRDWTGTMGHYGLQLAGGVEAATGLAPESNIPKPVITLADVPFVKAFIVRHPSAQLQPIQDFYNDFEKAQTIGNSINQLKNSGDLQGAQDLATKHQADMLQLTEVKKAIGNQAKFIQAVNQNPDMSPTDKRQLIDNAYYQMNQLAKEGNKAIDFYRKSLKH